MEIYQHTDTDGDRLYVGKVTGGGLMVTVEDSASRRSQVALTDVEAQKLYRELGQALGKDTGPESGQILSERRVRQIARYEAEAAIARSKEGPA